MCPLCVCVCARVCVFDYVCEIRLHQSCGNSVKGMYWRMGLGSLKERMSHGCQGIARDADCV